MIQFRTLFLSVFGLFMMACAREEIIVSEISVQDTPIGMQAQKGRLRLKFKSRFAGKAEQAVYTRAGTGDIRIVSMKRLFPFAGKFEERTRKAGLHLWYEVEFDEQTPVTRALALLGDTTEIEIAEPVYIIRNTGGEGTVPVRSAGERNSDGTAPFNDPELSRQWHYSNTGELPNSVAGADINLFAAWQKNQGSREVIVAVIDGGIDYRHEDLTGNVGNPAELFGEPGVDDDGNGYIDDIYGWNFINGTNQIEADDHGTHVAGTIGAENNNGVGVCGIAGGDGSKNSGVKIMSCQVFAGEAGVTLDAEARAIKYAADNGAVILQCSWGYNSSLANLIEGYTPGPGSEEEWEKLYPLEKDALDYFINNAGSPNGVIDGGLAIFASGNEYAGMAAFPAAYSKCISVSAVAADFTPASYSNYGKEVTISAPGGDTEYYNPVGQDDPEGWEEGIHSGSILSTWIQNGNATYGFMDGTSMACPHVSGVAALGLSYAVKQRRHFKASEFVELLKSSTKPLDSWYNTGEVKAYYRNHISSGASATRVELSKYVGKMGAGLLDAGMLLNNIEGNGSDMVVPNMYVAEGAASTLNLACYFVNGENLTYTCTSGDTTVASVSVNGTFMTVSGVKTGATRITVKVSNGSEQSITVTVRKKANDNGWM